MTFDDRLATVLSTPATDPHDRAIRWRQLVDLVARSGANVSPHTMRKALDEILSAREHIDVALRGAAARSIAGRPVPEFLLQIFASDTVEVAAPLLSDRAPSDAIRQAASDEVRRFLDAMYPLQKLLAVEPEDGEHEVRTAETPVQEPDVIPATAEPFDEREALSSLAPLGASPAELPSISELVARIEQLGRGRGEQVAAEAAMGPAKIEGPPVVAAKVSTPAQQSAVQPGSPALFRWECGAGGKIAWVEGAPRGALVGRSIARAEDEAEGVDAQVERAFARRSPFRDALLSLPDAGAVAGDWLLSGLPAFAPADGRFVGYRGIARRAEALGPTDTPNALVASGAASLRELVHEIKTPLNAIIGFAEIIDGQYLGPAQSGYRLRAAEIVAQARILLDAVNDLDLAARARGAGRAEGTQTELADYFEPLARKISDDAGKLGVRLIVDRPPAEGLGLLDRSLAERLLMRMAATLLAAASAGETLRLAAIPERKAFAVRMSLPTRLDGFAIDVRESAPGNHDSQFTSLRLLAGLARIVGGSLSRDGAELILRIPSAG